MLEINSGDVRMKVLQLYCPAGTIRKEIGEMLLEEYRQLFETVKDHSVMALASKNISEALRVVATQEQKWFENGFALFINDGRYVRMKYSGKTKMFWNDHEIVPIYYEEADSDEIYR